MGTKPITDGAVRRDIWLLDPTTVRVIGLNTDDGPEHPLYDPIVKELRAKLDGSLPLTEADEAAIASVVEHGQIVAATIRKDGATHVDVETGRRRWFWVTMANRRLPEGEEPIPFRAMQTDASVEDAGLRLGIENFHRDSKDFTYRIAYAARLAARGTTVPRIAVALGEKPPTVRSWLAVNAMHPDVLAAVVGGDVSVTRALDLQRLPAKEQARSIAAIVEFERSQKARTHRVGSVSGLASESESESETDDVPAPADTLPPSRRPQRPPARIVRRLITERVEAADADLPMGFVLALRWMRGEIQPEDVPGLPAALAARATD